MKNSFRAIFEMFKKHKRLTLTFGGLTFAHSVSMMAIPFIFREIQLLSHPETTPDDPPTTQANPLLKMAGSTSDSKTLRLL